MRQLMVVKTTGQLCFLQVGGDMLIRHFLKASLKKINFLHPSQPCLEHKSTNILYLFLAPSSSSPGRGRFSILLHPKLMSIDGIDWGVV